MPITKEDVRAFSSFADDRVSAETVESLAALADEWESDRRRGATLVDDICESHQDIAAGRVHSVAETFAEARRQMDSS